MSDATTVGSTRVTIVPDMSGFGEKLRVELPSAIREPAKSAGDSAGDLIRNAITKKLAKPFRVKVQAALDDAAFKAELQRLTKEQKVKVVAELDDKAAVAGLDKLTRDRTVSIRAEIDDKQAKTQLGALSGQQTVDILPKIQQAAYQQAMKQLDRLCADRVVNIRASVDTRVAAAEIKNLLQRRKVNIGVDVDTRVAADSLANLTRRRTMTVQARADTTAANASLNHVARTRTADIRVRGIGLAGLTGSLNNLGSSSGGGAGGVGVLSSRIAKLVALAVGAFPTIASLTSAIAQMGPAAATAAPAVAALGTAFGVIKLGMMGVGDAVKAAFNPVASEATKAANATRAVENAQRSLARAQQSLKDAQVQAADQVRQAQQQVANSERDLSSAQRDARQAQQDLTAARRQAVRDLQDMNNSLRDSQLSERQATLAVQQAEEDLARVRSDPTSTQLQIQQAVLTRDQAVQSLDEQRLATQRLQKDTAAANKAGVEGSKSVTDARRKVADTEQEVADRQRALAEAQAQVVKAQVQGQRQIADAQQAVADAARAVADAQDKAATQTTKLDTAMAKLSPKAQAFVRQLQAMGPAWRDMRMDVQDRLFDGLATRLGQVGSQILPTVRTGLRGTAGELNTMGLNALTAVADLEKAGTLRQVFDGVRTSLGTVSRIPAQMVTGFAQLAVAAQPAFDRINKGAADTVDRWMKKLDQGLKDGSLTTTINHALDVTKQLWQFLKDVGGLITGIFKAAGAAGGDFFGTFGAAVAEMRRIVEMPEVQKALTAIFKAVNSVAKLLAGALGQAIQTVLPILAALAPVVGQLTEILGPVLAQVISALGQALAPVAAALGPVLVQAAQALGQLVVALTPLLPPLGQLIAALLPALTPILQALSTVFTALAPVIQQVAQAIGPVLLPVIKGLSDVIAKIVTQFGAMFLKLLKDLLPIVPALVPLLVQVGKSIGQILTALAPLIPQLMLFAVQILEAVLPALIPLLPPLLQLITLLLRLATWVIVKVVVPALGLLVSFLNGLRKKLQPAVDAVKWLTDKIAGFFEWLYDHLLGHSVIPDIVNGTIRWFTDMWKGVKKIFSDLKTDATRIWNSFWGGVKSTVTESKKTVLSNVDKFGDNLKDAFRGIRDGVGDIWKSLKSKLSAPIKFWIETVYNKGVVGVWNATAGKLPGVPSLHKMATPKGLARGGILPGWSTWRDGDDQLVPMRRGEGVYVSEVMRDPYERARLHAMNQAAIRGQHPAIARAQYGFSEGGIFGSLGDGLKSIGSGIADSVGSVLQKSGDVARGGLAVLAEKAFKPVKSGITKALGSNTRTWPGMVATAPLMLIDKAIDYIRGKDIPEGSGQWIKPVNVPFGTRFGVRGPMWSSGRHTGLDFPAATGTRVVAVDNGTVQSATNGGPYGKHVTISHGGGLASLYAHMSAIAAKVGAGIKQGARVGSVGATGNVTGPHLHLEARLNGKAVDPMPYLTGGADVGEGVGRWRGVVRQALSQVHQSLSLVDTTLRRMSRESGGNPRAVNKWDANWLLGHPSVGLMQVIKGTFQRYAGPYRKTGPFLYGVSVDPLANVYASMKYALASYGSLSRAYDRPGGYARGGILGGGVRIHQGLSRGYASGGIIKVGKKKIDTGPIAASVGSDFLKQLIGTAAQISAAMTQVTDAIKTAFKGVKTDLDNKLLARLAVSNKQLQALATARDAITAKITAANQLAADSKNQAMQFAQMTSLPNGGNTFGAGGILSGLTVRLQQIREFGKNIKILGDRGLSKALLQQIISAGPDQGAAYAKALVDATPAQLKQINATQDAITKASSKYGQDAADAMYDAGSQSGKGYLAGLKAQEASINHAMSALAKKIQDAIKKALKIKSPSRVFAQLGAFTVAGFAQGVRETAPQAALATARMAALVRTSAAAAATRVENTTSTATYGDRVLNYQATVREQASRASILAALAMEDMLHRPVMSGG